MYLYHCIDLYFRSNNLLFTTTKYPPIKKTGHWTEYICRGKFNVHLANSHFITTRVCHREETCYKSVDKISYIFMLVSLSVIICIKRIKSSIFERGNLTILLFRSCRTIRGFNNHHNWQIHISIGWKTLDEKKNLVTLNRFFSNRCGNPKSVRGTRSSDLQIQIWTI